MPVPVPTSKTCQGLPAAGRALLPHLLQGPEAQQGAGVAAGAEGHAGVNGDHRLPRLGGVFLPGRPDDQVVRHLQGLEMGLPGLGPVLGRHLADLQTQGREFVGAEALEIVLQLLPRPVAILLRPEVGPDEHAAGRDVLFFDDHAPAAEIGEKQGGLFLHPGGHDHAHLNPGFFCHIE